MFAPRGQVGPERAVLFAGRAAAGRRCVGEDAVDLGGGVVEVVQQEEPRTVVAGGRHAVDRGPCRCQQHLRMGEQVLGEGGCGVTVALGAGRCRSRGVGDGAVPVAQGAQRGLALEVDHGEAHGIAANAGGQVGGGQGGGVGDGALRKQAWGQRWWTAGMGEPGGVVGRVWLGAPECGPERKVGSTVTG
ncbi:hypothetical protein [Streptomyces niveus]|uniref:hypothetical protein n=1 Tax=Streptomyces niveus TaxID=193462 RepID=UPI0036809AED